MDIIQILNGKDIMYKLEETFTEIYEKNLWQSAESVSGLGSEMNYTKSIRKELPIVLKKYNIESFLDIPCGDWNWMKTVDLCGASYIGADIVKPLIEKNKIKYPNIDFRVLDLTKDELPKVDLVFVRDCLGHLTNENVHKAIANIRNSGSKYLLATSFTRWNINPDIQDGGWKCINLMIEPFTLKPIYLINEEFDVGYPHYNDKCMILFKMND
jgi:SAM-dependent methyltransferase